LSAANQDLASSRAQNQHLQEQVAVVKDSAASSAATLASVSAALSASEAQLEKARIAVEEQKAAHSHELLQIHNEQLVSSPCALGSIEGSHVCFRVALRESAALIQHKYCELQSRCAAEDAAASADRVRLSGVLREVEQLTSLNQKLSAALAVSQLQAAVGVQELLSEVSRPHLCVGFHM
jgi:hypothetical protein